MASDQPDNVKLDPFDNSLLGHGIPNYVLDPKSYTEEFPPLATADELWAMNKFYEQESTFRKMPAVEVTKERPPFIPAAEVIRMASSSVFHQGEGLNTGYDANADWIQTHSGRRFNPLNPNPDAIVIQDIAHSLSMQCRFSGHCKEFYCVTPDTKVLTSDLVWKPAGDLHIFEGLVGFDEYPNKVFKNNRNRRKMKYSSVLHTGRMKRHVYALHLSDGTILKSSDEHPWLVCSKKSRNQKWETTSEIISAIQNGKQRFMLKFVEPWQDYTHDSEVEYAVGYLAGIFDGEATINCNRKGFLISVAQNPGPVMDKIKVCLDEFGFKYSEFSSKKCHNLQLTGTWSDKLKFLGLIKPIRLVEKYKQHLKNEEWKKEFDSVATLSVVKVEDLGIQEVVTLETSTKTYFAEGFGSHNSVAQHSVLVSYICDSEDALWGLLHDASEAYLVDVPRPLKRSGKFQAYIDFETVMQEAVCRRFALPFEEPPTVKWADKILLATEARDLMSPLHSDWEQSIEPLPFKIEPWDHNKAKDMFMKRFFELSGAPDLHYQHYLQHRDVL